MAKEVKQWITVNGVHVPIFEGESKAEAVKRAVTKQKKSKGSTKEKTAKSKYKPDEDDHANAEDRTERIAIYKEQLQEVQEDIEQFERTSPRLRAPDYEEKLSQLKKKEKDLKGWIERDLKPWKDKKSKEESIKEKQIKENKKQADERNGKKNVSTKSAKPAHRDKNVSDVLTAAGWTGENKPMFIDKMTHGYRVSLYTKDEKEATKMLAKLKKKSGVNITMRKRTGYGAKAGSYDMIIPFYKEKR